MVCCAIPTLWGEALAAKGPFPVRRIKLDDYLDDFFLHSNTLPALLYLGHLCPRLPSK